MRYLIISILVIGTIVGGLAPDVAVARQPKISIHFDDGHSRPHPRPHRQDTVVWNKSIFIVTHDGRIYAHHYNYQTIDDLVNFHYHLGHYQVSLIPVGRTGAIPHHLRAYAVHRFEQSGIRVLPHHRPAVKHHHQKKAKRKVKTEDVVVDLMSEIIKSGRR